MGTGNSGMGFIPSIICLAIGVFVLVSMWKVFVKAGHPGWAAIVPIYNLYILCKIAQKPGWWVLLLIIPFVNIVVSLIVSVAISQNFGKTTLFGVGLWLLGVIFYPVLAFGDAQYRPVAAAATGGTAR
jgi:hypothetical protein